MPLVTQKASNRVTKGTDPKAWICGYESVGFALPATAQVGTEMQECRNAEMQKCGTRAGAESDEAGVVEGGSHCLHGGFKSSVLRSPHGPALASILIAWGIVARDLDARIFKFACRIVDLYEQLHVRNGAARELGRQLLRSGTSVGANYAEAAAGQTKADFIARLAIARRESRESLFWLRLIEAKGYLKDPGLAEDVSEAQQLTAILRAIIIKARSSPRRG